jgi:sporulation protein YlmC with PRC-barrel domain
MAHSGKEGLRMMKIRMVALGFIFAFGLLVANAFTAEEMDMGLGRPYGVSEMVRTDVKNLQGEELGRITDFVIDSQGRVAFAILSHGGFLRMGEKSVAIPFKALSYDRKGRHFVLDMSKDRLKSAPSFALRDLYNEKWAGEDYRYFGQQPYWTEGELVMPGIVPPEEPSGSPEGIPYPY